jgi:hypothetical protein
MEYTCPVCGYDQLEDPAMEDEICPSCGTQFGYHDFNKSHQQLRLLWIRKGMQWHSRVDEKPLEWNPHNQLRCADFLGRQEIAELERIGYFSETKNSIAVVRLNQETFQYRILGTGKVTIATNWLAIGIEAKGIGRTSTATI